MFSVPTIKLARWSIYERYVVDQCAHAAMHIGHAGSACSSGRQRELWLLVWVTDPKPLRTWEAKGLPPIPISTSLQSAQNHWWATPAVTKAYTSMEDSKVCPQSRVKNLTLDTSNYGILNYIQKKRSVSMAILREIQECRLVSLWLTGERNDWGNQEYRHTPTRSLIASCWAQR